MRFTLQSAGTELDVCMSAGSTTLTASELFAAAGLGSGPTIAIDGTNFAAADTPVAALGLADGAILSAQVPGPVDRKPDRHVVAELICVAGPGTGTALPLRPGVFDLNLSGSQSTSTGTAVALVRIEVGHTGSVRIGALAGRVIEVDGQPTGEATVLGSWFSVKGSVFRVAPAQERGPGRPRLTGRWAADGRVDYVRSPRVMPQLQSQSIVAPPPLRRPSAPPPMSLLLLLMPLPIGIALAYFLSPFYLMFVLLSPLMALGRSIEGKRRVKRIEADNTTQRTEDIHRFRLELEKQSRLTAQHHREQQRDLHSLKESAQGDTELWRSRPHHPDFLRPSIGIGRRRWNPDILGDTSADDLQATLAEAAVLPMCPSAVDLHDGLAIGIAGPPALTRRVAASLILQLVTEHGPADVRLAALIDSDAARFWDQIKWLPHLIDASGVLRVATSSTDAEKLAAETVCEPERSGFQPNDRLLETPVPIFLVDHPTLVSQGVRCLASRLPRATARAVIIATTVDELPAFCTSVVQVDGRSGLLDVTDVADITGGRHRHGIVPHLPDVNVIGAICRSLARFSDPDDVEQAATLPSFAHLTSIIDVPPDAEELGRAWQQERPGCTAVLGATENGALEVDMITDGPHALIAGTTGAGKSELLRTMIVSMAARHRPDQVTFVLVDFKGGGAFDVFQRLPHTVGVVTDLDQHLASRALRCLRAELTHREHRLRDAGVSDLIDLPASERSLPRLVIVVDEFATLAAELPDFLSSLIDIAQRGRSLGIHMVLATQRPSGVVDNKIRANTNLRIALRVQDEHDSMDVIGTPAAAAIDRRHPGRALARLGASEVVGFQTALVSVRTVGETGPRLQLEPFDLLATALDARVIGSTVTPQASSTDAAADPAAIDDDDLARYVIAAHEANHNLALGPQRVPWPDPLPESLDIADLLAGAAEAGHGQWDTPFGLVDIPDRQRQESAWWRADEGNTVIYGLGPAPSANAAAVIAFGLAARHHPDDVHLYVIDLVGSLAPIRSLPHVGSYVTGDEGELLIRTLNRLETELADRRALVGRNQLTRIGRDDGRDRKLPLITVVITNYGALPELFDELGELDGPARLARIVRDGPALGLNVVIAAGSERDVPGRVAQQIETKLVLRMADPNSYLMFGLRPKDLPELGPGRAIDVRDGSELQIGDFGSQGLAGAVNARKWPTGGPAAIQALADHVSFNEIAEAAEVDGTVWRLAIGVGHRDLQPIGLDLRAGQHAMVVGPAGSGKTTALQTLARAARHSDPSATMVVAASRPEEWEQVIASLNVLTLTELLDPERQPSAGRTLIIVDGIEAVPVPTELFEQLAANPRSGLHLLIGGRPESFRVPPQWVRTIAAGRTGVALSAGAETGDVFRTRLSTRNEVVPTGRGHVINQGQPELCQIAISRFPATRTESAAEDVPVPQDQSHNGPFSTIANESEGSNAGSHETMAGLRPTT